ncbi:MAG: Indole-3-glycerol phosphate synthase [Fimbriimonadales bacterium]|nr:Indole-3-glycerol phosphate synthase [Fimbriimonadales bacterium]
MSLLQEILAHKRSEVDALRAKTPIEDLTRVAEGARPPRGFRHRLVSDSEKNGIAIIAEFKRASPSQGMIRDDMDPSAVAGAYESGGASCISVLTDDRYFRGSLEDMIAARIAVSLPVLRKDFVIDEYQVIESRANGADCVLLIVAAFKDHPESLHSLYLAARRLGMDVLVEVHDEEELSTAKSLNSDLIGINNRDLSTFETDLGVTARLAPLAPPDALIVSESAIRCHADVESARQAGARAVLVGESLVRQPDPASAVRGLLSP